MNRTIIFAVALLVMAAGTAEAQSGGSKTKSVAKTKQGAKFSFNTVSTIDMTMSLMGQEISSAGTTTGRTELTAKKVDKSQTEWIMAVPSLHVTMSNPIDPSQSVDTTLAIDPQTYLTDPTGKVLRAPEETESARMQMAMGGAMMKNFAHWFTPTLPKGAQSGATWMEERRDTMNMNGMDVVATQSLRYTYDGITDTLGVKVARIRWSATSVKYEGGGSMEGNTMTLDGDGGVNGTSYYSTKDGMLFASRSETEGNLRLGVNAGGQEMVIPMVLSTSLNIVRQM